MARNRALALRARDILCETLGIPRACPDEMIGSLASLPLPVGQPGSPVASLDHEKLMDWTRARGVESWFCAWDVPSRRLVRISAQAYNHEAQYHRLAGVLQEALHG
jgi:isopenicillin-N epimerase